MSPHPNESIPICPLCGGAHPYRVRDFRRTAEPDLVARLVRHHPGWKETMGACPACVDRARWEQARGESTAVRNTPLLRLRGYQVPPTPVRMGADPSVTGRGVTIAFVDSGFSLHPDLCMPQMRIRAYHDVEDPIAGLSDLAGPDLLSWHGTMTSVVAAGSGFLSHGVYRGIAPGADLVLVRVSNEAGRQPDRNICAGLDWLLENRVRFGLRVVNVSLRGDAPAAGGSGPVEKRVRALTEAGVLVVAASGNEMASSLFPPATCPEALTVGGLDDGLAGRTTPTLYHSNWDGSGFSGRKPEVVAPALWIASPILPGTEIFRKSRFLTLALLAEGRERRRLVRRWRELLGVSPDLVDTGGKALLAELEEMAAREKVIAPYHHHADGTSVAAPIVSAVAAQVLEVAPFLSPGELKELIIRSAAAVEGEPVERQGWGVVSAGRAVALARQLVLSRGHSTDEVASFPGAGGRTNR